MTNPQPEQSLSGGGFLGALVDVLQDQGRPDVRVEVRYGVPPYCEDEGEALCGGQDQASVRKARESTGARSIVSPAPPFSLGEWQSSQGPVPQRCPPLGDRSQGRVVSVFAGHARGVGVHAVAA